MDSTWFANALRAEMARRRMSHRAMAAFLGRGKSAVTQWLLGSRYPAFAEFCEVCEKLGWDLTQVMPAEIRRAAMTSKEAAAELSVVSEPYTHELVDLMMKALSSEIAQVRHFAFAVLEDRSLALSTKQAELLADRMATLSKDKRIFLSSHYVLIANRLLAQTDAPIGLLGHQLVTSTNILVRYRALAGFLDHPQHAEKTVHFVRSAMLDRKVPRSDYELACLRAAESQEQSDERCVAVEAIRRRSNEATVYDLVEAFDLVMQDARGEFAWYHALDAASRCEREGPALLMHAFRQLERQGGRDASNRQRDIVATINRAGVATTILCDDFLGRLLESEDPWLVFHAVAAYGKWAPRDEELASLMADTLTRAIPTYSDEEAQVAPMCCYALAKMRVASREVIAALTRASRSKGWLRAIGRTAIDSLQNDVPLQDTLARMLEAA